MAKSKDEGSKRPLAPAESAALTRVRSSWFKYYIHDSIDACRLQLLGELTEADVPELNGCWRTARTTLANRKLVLDLRGLKVVDEAGKQWLVFMTSEGAAYLPDSFLRNGLVGQDAADAASRKASGKPGFFGKVLSILKGPAAEPTQAQ